MGIAKKTFNGVSHRNHNRSQPPIGQNKYFGGYAVFEANNFILH
jgi:hypothetical protein